MSIRSLSSRVTLPASSKVASTETGAMGTVSPRDLVGTTETGAKGVSPRDQVASTETGAKGIVSPRDLVATTETGARVASTETGVGALAAHQNVSGFDS